MEYDIKQLINIHNLPQTNIYTVGIDFGGNSFKLSGNDSLTNVNSYLGKEMYIYILFVLYLFNRISIEFSNNRIFGVNNKVYFSFYFILDK